MLSLKINITTINLFVLSLGLFISLFRLSCGVTALFGLMMACVGSGTVVYASAQIMNFPNHSRSLTVAFLLKT